MLLSLGIIVKIFRLRVKTCFSIPEVTEEIFDFYRLIVIEQLD